MARPLRIEYPGALYHITARGNERKDIFLSDHDRNQFLRVLFRIVKLHNWLLHSYCLMGNHYHILVETPDGNLSKGMRDLNGIYSQIFNRIHGRDGHLFQGRFKSFVIEKETYLLEVSRYIVLNPVRANLVAEPKDWKWSSYRAIAGYINSSKSLTIDWILTCFSGEKREAQNNYREFVKAGMGSDNPFNNSVEGNILGYPQFVDYIWSLKSETDELQEVPCKERMIGRPALEDILSNLENKKQRDIMIVTACTRCNYSQKEVADYLGLHYSTVSKALANSRFKT